MYGNLFVLTGILFIFGLQPPISGAKNYITRKEKKFRATCESDEAVSGLAFRGIKGSNDYKIVIKCKSLLSEKDKKQGVKIAKGKTRYTDYVKLGGKAKSSDISKTCQGGEYIRGVQGVFVKKQRRIRFKCQSTDQGTKRKRAASGSITATLCHSASVKLDVKVVKLNPDPLGRVDDGFPLDAVNYVEVNGLGITARFCSMQVDGVEYSKEYNEVLDEGESDSSYECTDECCSCDCDKACEIECEKDSASEESSEESDKSSSESDESDSKAEGEECTPGGKKKKHFGMHCGIKCQLRCATWRPGVLFGTPIADCKAKKGDKKESCYCEYDAQGVTGGEGRCSEGDPESEGTADIEGEGGDEEGAAEEAEQCSQEEIDKMELDIVFVIDESLSVGAPNYQKGLEFASNLCRSFDIDSGKCRVGGIRYSGLPYFGVNIDFKLTTHTTSSGACGAIAAMKYAAGRTATGEALRVANMQVLPEARSSASKLVFVLTDGNTNDGVDPAITAADLRATGAVIIAFGVGDNLNPDELLAIAGSPDNAFSVSSYDALATLDMTKILTAVCMSAQAAQSSCMGGCVDSGTMFHIAGDCEAVPAERRRRKRSDDEKWFGAGHCKKEGACNAKCESWKPAGGYESYEAVCEPKQDGKKDSCHCIYSSERTTTTTQSSTSQASSGCEEMCQSYAPGIAYGENSVAECRPKTCFEDDDDDDDDESDSSESEQSESNSDSSGDSSATTEATTKAGATDTTTDGEGCTTTTEKWFGAGHCKKEGKCDKKCASWKPAGDYDSYEAICEPKKDGKKDFCHCIYESTSEENCNQECYCEYVNPDTVCAPPGAGSGSGGGGLSVGVKECSLDQWFGESFCKKVNNDPAFDKATYDKSAIDDADLEDCKEKCESYNPGIRVGPNTLYECDFENDANSKTHCHCEYESEDESCTTTTGDPSTTAPATIPPKRRRRATDRQVVCAADNPECGCDACECGIRRRSRRK